jgi:hypothetical protein
MKLPFFGQNQLVAPALLCFVLFFSSLVSVVNWFRRIIKSTKRGGFYGAMERDVSERAKDDAERAKDGGGAERAN